MPEQIQGYVGMRDDKRVFGFMQAALVDFR